MLFSETSQMSVSYIKQNLLNFTSQLHLYESFVEDILEGLWATYRDLQQMVSGRTA